MKGRIDLEPGVVASSLESRQDDVRSGEEPAPDPDPGPEPKGVGKARSRAVENHAKVRFASGELRKVRDAPRRARGLSPRKEMRWEW